MDTQEQSLTALSFEIGRVSRLAPFSFDKEKAACDLIIQWMKATRGLCEALQSSGFQPPKSLRAVLEADAMVLLTDVREMSMCPPDMDLATWFRWLITAWEEKMERESKNSVSVTERGKWPL